MDCFDALPLAVLVNEHFLCLHGGISPDIKTLADIDKINRLDEIPKKGPFCDLVWADPIDNDTGDLDKTWVYNESRGCSFVFGKDALNTFLTRNNLLSVIRAHEAQLDGFKM